MTDKILGRDRNPEGREWQSQSSEAERNFYLYALGRISDDMAMHEGGTIRTILENLQKREYQGKTIWLPASELWRDDCRLKDASDPGSLLYEGYLNRQTIDSLTEGPSYQRAS